MSKSMNMRRLKRDLRRLAQREVPREPDLWPAVRARVAHTARPHSASDGTSSYVWHADARPQRWGTATRIAATGVAVLVLVVVLAVLFNQHDGDQQPAALGGQASPVASSVASGTPSAAGWTPEGSVTVPIEPFGGTTLSGTIDARLYLTGDLTVLPSLKNPPSTLFWHVVAGRCDAWSGLTETDANGRNLAPPFYSMGEAAAARIVVPADKTHQPMALVAFDPDSGASIGCAAIPAVPSGFTVTAQVDPSVPSTCAVSRPSVPPFIPSDPEDRNPPGPSVFWYGSDDLRTALPLSGVFGQANRTRMYYDKFFWQSASYHGEAMPDITITGQRLDGDSTPLIVDRPTTASGPGIGQSMLVGIGFPTPGCWQVTADYAGHSLSFVAWVAGQWSAPTPSAMTAAATPTSADLPFPVTNLAFPSPSAPCNDASVAQLLANFVDAFNDGDQARLRTFFPDHDSDYFQTGVERDQFSLFQLFAQNEFLGPQSWDADNRADLLQAFAQRHAAHEHWTMVSVKYAAANTDSAFIQPRFTAQADDLSLRTFEGRGVINCAQGWITTWVVSDTEVLTAPPPANATPVPPEPDATPLTLPPMPPLPSLPDNELGTTCGMQEAGTLILQFIKAVNDGDQAALASLFPDAPSVTIDQGEGLQLTPNGRNDLLALLALLRQQGTWESQRIVAASQEHGGAIQFDINVVTDDHIMFTQSGVGLVNCDNQQIVAWQMTESPPIPVSDATPTANAPVSLAQADVVWGTIADRTDGTIDPILRPSRLPLGFDSIQLRNAVPGAYEVGYQGATADLRIGAEAYTPPEVGPSGSQQQITVRGQRAVVQIESTLHPVQRIWLWWHEPGTWKQSGLTDPKGIFYMITASGLSPDQVVQIANNLTPLPATGTP